METELLNYFVRGIPLAQPRPRARIMRVHGKPVVQIYDQLRSYEPGDARPRIRKAWDPERWRDRIIERTRSVSAGVSGLPIEGPIQLDLDLYFPRPDRLLTAKSPAGKIRHTAKPDFDNAAKLICDAITKSGWREFEGETIKTPLVWADDAQVCDCIVRRWYVARGDSPGARIIITRLEEPEGSLLALAEGVARG